MPDFNFNESPYFRYTIPIGLEPDAIYPMNYVNSELEEARFLPMNSIFLNNIGAQIGELQLFTSQLKKDILGGQSLKLSDVEFVGWNYKNTDTVATTKKIEILVRREITELILLKEILKTLQKGR